MARRKPEARRPGKRRESLAQQVLRLIQQRKILHAGERVGVAVSGGADSVALLLLLEELREKLGIVLSVVHFNHKLRGRASEADEKFVARLAAASGLPFHADRADVAAEAKRARANLEETARRLRYEFFARLVKEGRADRIGVAHTADDQAETVLAHILRGTGLAGLGGIHPIAGPVIRPLLGIRRSELRAYLRAKKQTWREDATNQDATRLRARIRRKLLPLLEKEFQPAAVEHLTALAERAREDEAFFRSVTEERAAAMAFASGDGVRIRVADLLQPGKKGAGALDRALSKRLLRRLLEGVKQRPGQITSRHIEAILELAEHGQSGKALQLPGGLEARREIEEIFLHPGPAPVKEMAGSRKARRVFEHAVELRKDGAAVRVPETGCVLRLRVIDWPAERRETSTLGAVLDRDRLQGPLVLRNWRPGDRFRPAGRRKTHKLKRLLNEKRVSRWEREGWPVLTSGGVLVWVRGFPAAAEFAPDARTQAGIVIAEEML